MKRRNFVLLTTMAAVSLGVPFAGCDGRRRSLVRTLARPDFLSRVCDGATILEIGAAYRAQTPAEAKEDRLVDLLLAEMGDTQLAQSLASHIRDNYTTGKIVTLKGWVLSLTEARQCALYSIEMQ